MSRIGKQPIEMPNGVSATQEGQRIIVKGSRGELSFEVPEIITVTIEGQTILCAPKSNSKESAAMWGTSRARLKNMVEGVSEGFKKELELHGVGYKAAVNGKNLELQVGFSHPILINAPDNITFTVDSELITVEGIDKVVVGQVAANIRAIRKPEPYKGKGVRYKGEIVRRKVGKVVGVAS